MPNPLHSHLLALIQLPRLPTGRSQDDTLALPDTVDLLPIGRAAERIFADSLHNVPRQLRAWAVGAYEQFLILLPRLIIAIALASAILAIAVLLRGVVRKRRDEIEEEGGTSIVILGILIATTVAAAVANAERLAAAALTFSLFYGIATVLRIFGPGALERARAAPEAVELTLIVIRYAILIVGTVEALATLGLNLGGVIAGLGILGLALGFAAQDSLSNLIAGFMILWDRALRVGDWISIGDAEGRVRRITLRTTRIETRDEGVLIIPNKEVTGSRIYNFSLRNLTRVRVPVDVHYEADIIKARQVMLDLVPDDEFVSSKPDPFVVVSSLGESGVTMELVFFITDPREAVPLRWRLLERVLLAFRKHGIEITYPHLNLHLRSGVLNAQMLERQQRSDGADSLVDR